MAYLLKRGRLIWEREGRGTGAFIRQQRKVRIANSSDGTSHRMMHRWDFPPPLKTLIALTHLTKCSPRSFLALSLCHLRLSTTVCTYAPCVPDCHAECRPPSPLLSLLFLSPVSLSLTVAERRREYYYCSRTYVVYARSLSSTS